MSESGWEWTTTGSQSSTLEEENGFRKEFGSNAAGPIYYSSVDKLTRTTAATQTTHSASVARTSTTGDGVGSYTTTSPVGTYALTGSGSGEYAVPLVPIGTDGLQFAFGGAALNYDTSPGLQNDVFDTDPQ